MQKNTQIKSNLPSQKKSALQSRKFNAEQFLIRLYQKKLIDEQELKAGLQYIHDFMRAGLNGHFARVHYHNIGVNSISGQHANDNYNPSEQQIACRYRIGQNEKKLGKLAASCLYNVLGLEISIKDYAHKISSGSFQGYRKSLTAHQAMGVLLSGLAILSQTVK